METIYLILRKKHPITVLKRTVGDLDLQKMSPKALDKLQASTYSTVFVKCDINGNIEYRGKKQEYRLYDLSHPILGTTAQPITSKS